MKIGKELLKGSTGLLVLSVIAEEDMYGYQIIQLIESRSENVFKLKEGTLYPILHAFEREGYIQSYIGESETGRERKYYKITPSGKLWLASKKEEWNVFSEAVQRIVGAHGGK